MKKSFSRKKMWSALIAITFFIGCATAQKSTAQEQQKGSVQAPAPQEKTPPLSERTYASDFDTVWEKVTDVLKEKGLHDHPHGKAVFDKTSGKITTPTCRYFKISFAGSPPLEKDYRDSYTLTVTAEGSPAQNSPQKPPLTKVAIERKFEVLEETSRNWATGNPEKERVGMSGEEILNAIESRLTGPSGMTEGISPCALSLIEPF